MERQKVWFGNSEMFWWDMQADACHCHHLPREHISADVCLCITVQLRQVGVHSIQLLMKIKHSLLYHNCFCSSFLGQQVTFTLFMLWVYFLLKLYNHFNSKYMNSLQYPMAKKPMNLLEGGYMSVKQGGALHYNSVLPWISHSITTQVATISKIIWLS